MLVLLPETLVYQWYVELLRRFNLTFAIYDEERCEAIELGGDGRNPFEDEQLVIAALGFLRDAPRRAGTGCSPPGGICWSSTKRTIWRGRRTGQCRATRWWSARRHDARRDPAHRHAANNSAAAAISPACACSIRQRYRDLERYRPEAEGYAQLSRIVETLQSGQALDDAERARWRRACTAMPACARSWIAPAATVRRPAPRCSMR